jgi:hypothetical protein
MHEGYEELHLAPRRCARLAAKRRRLSSGLTSLEKSDIAFLIATCWRRRPTKWGGPGVKQSGGREPINAAEASWFLAIPLYFQEFRYVTQWETIQGIPRPGARKIRGRVNTKIRRRIVRTWHEEAIEHDRLCGDPGKTTGLMLNPGRDISRSTINRTEAKEARRSAPSRVRP